MTWEITPAVLTVQTESAEKKYDGKPLTASGSINGLVNDETVQFAVTGSQTKSGKSVNTYELKWNGTAKESNYLLVENLGTLTVTTPTSPKTGDSNSPWFWASSMFGSGAILAAMLIIRKKKKS